MQIIDKYGYLDNALDYIEGHIVSGWGLQKIAKRAKINKDSMKSLSSSLRGFSGRQFFAVLQENIFKR